MTLAQWLPFAIAFAILVAIPGPTVLLVVSYALSATAANMRLPRRPASRWATSRR
ncbi:MAG: hypothetical protein CBARDMAM_3869 [uncultured Caballeronia sp.]|nr:MAG: hypothetical protein CBARDMAM_3869 [uncultured Caballeronia sp.]